MLKLTVSLLALLILGCHGPGAGGPAAPTAGSDASAGADLVADSGT